MPRILIVDDDSDSAKMQALLLDAHGFATQAVTDPQLAPDAFTAFRPDVVLLDLGMPGLNGFELCRSIRAFPGAEGVLIVVVSGFDRPEHKAMAMEAGANYYFVKPADPERLIELVKAA